MGKCRLCGGYASEGKQLCPWDQIRHGEFVKGKWVVAVIGPAQEPEKGQQTELKLEE